MPRTEAWEAAELLARGQTPDGALTLRVHRTIERGEPLISMGFEEGAWHFHPTADEALRIYQAVLADRVVIVGTTLHEETTFALMGNLEFELDGAPNDISYQFRLWSGPISFEDLVDGKVHYLPLDELWNWRI